MRGVLKICLNFTILTTNTIQLLKMTYVIAEVYDV